MRPVLLRAAAAAALATALCAGPTAMAQEVPAAPQESLLPPGLELSTGYDLWPLAQQLIDATRAEVAFAAAHDTRFRVVQHLETGFTCSFVVGSEALVAVVAVEDLSKTGDDSVCMEEIDGTVNSFRIAHLSGQSIDEVFEGARETAAGWLSGDVAEAQSAPNMTHSPEQPSVALDVERRQVLLTGTTAEGPALLRIAVARRPGDWYIIQHYFAPMTTVPAEQQAVAAELGSAVAEAVFAIRLGELLHPTIDPMFATGADGQVLR